MFLYFHGLGKRTRFPCRRLRARVLLKNCLDASFRRWIAVTIVSCCTCEIGAPIKPHCRHIGARFSAIYAFTLGSWNTPDSTSAGTARTNARSTSACFRFSGTRPTWSRSSRLSRRPWPRCAVMRRRPRPRRAPARVFSSRRSTGSPAGPPSSAATCCSRRTSTSCGGSGTTAARSWASRRGRGRSAARSCVRRSCCGTAATPRTGR